MFPLLGDGPALILSLGIYTIAISSPGLIEAAVLPLPAVGPGFRLFKNDI